MGRDSSLCVSAGLDGRIRRWRLPDLDGDPYDGYGGCHLARGAMALSPPRQGTAAAPRVPGPVASVQWPRCHQFGHLGYGVTIPAAVSLLWSQCHRPGYGVTTLAVASLMWPRCHHLDASVTALVLVSPP